MRCFFLIAISIVILCSCENDIAMVEQLVSDRDTRIERGKNVEITYSDSSRMLMIIEAEVLERHLDPSNQKDIFPNGVIVHFFDQNNEEVSQLVANYAERDPRENIITVLDSVVLTRVTGEILETSELNWSEQSGEIYTDRFVQVTRDEEIIQAFGLRANQDFSSYEFMKVIGRMKVEKPE